MPGRVTRDQQSRAALACGLLLGLMIIIVMVVL
jgi:hypothetical protein